MPNSSSTRRGESYYMPPKKFYLRLDNTNLSTAPAQEISNFASAEDRNHKMGLLEEEMKSNPPMEILYTEKPMSPQYDAPLDFSIKNPNRKSNNKLSPSSDEKTVTNVELEHPSFRGTHYEYAKRLSDMSSMPIPQVNGKSSTTVSNGNPGKWLPNGWNKHDEPPCNGCQSSPSRDCSENGNDYSATSPSVKTGLNGAGMPYASPDGSSTPERNSSGILQRMLSEDTGKINKLSSKLHNVNISPDGLYQGGNSEFMNGMRHIMSSTSQQIPVPASLISPVNNMMSLPIGHYPFLPGINYGVHATPSEAHNLETLTEDRPRRKKSENRPFKTYPIEKISEKLHAVSANAFAFGIDYGKFVTNEGPSTSPPSDLSANHSMDGCSPEPTNVAISSNHALVSNGLDTTPNAHGSGDSNDSIMQGAGKSESAANGSIDGRKRKSTADVDKDEAYWDRRRKNNLAAKRSREARRRKEDAIAKMAGIFEVQNKQLNQYAISLQYQLTEAAAQYSRLVRDYESQVIQNNVLQERLSQKRCGQCGAQLPKVN